MKNRAAKPSGSSKYEVTSKLIDQSGPLTSTGNSVTQCQSATVKMPAASRSSSCPSSTAPNTVMLSTNVTSSASQKPGRMRAARRMA